MVLRPSGLSTIWFFETARSIAGKPYALEDLPLEDRNLIGTSTMNSERWRVLYSGASSLSRGFS
jgi:hypothetical protein